MSCEVTTYGSRDLARGPSPSQGDLFSVSHMALQLMLTCMVLYLWSSPFAQPLNLMAVLFHEIGHGVMALFTGGKIISIQVGPNEAGSCETDGGSGALIVTAGYLGSMFVGGMLLYLSRTRHFVPLVFGLLTLILVAAITTVIRDSYSRTFASGLAVFFVLCGFLAPLAISTLLLRFIGTFTCLYSIKDIYCDVLDDQGVAFFQNDAVEFSRMTGMEPQFVGLAWLIGCLIFFLLVLKNTLHSEEDLPEPEIIREGESFNLPDA